MILERNDNMKLRLAGLFAAGLVASTAFPALGSGTFHTTGSMNVARASHTGTLLQTGKVLVAGGAITVPGNPYPSTETINSSELWDVSTQAWTSTGNLHDSRSGESMSVLPNGQVLAAGGGQSTKHSNRFVILASAELYTP
jgi:hypothetical protein